MTKLMTTLTISAIASIMIIGGFVLAPDAYSDKNNNEPDECACEKPDTLKVKFNAPVGSQESTFKIDVFKKFEDRNDPKKIPLMTFDNVPKVHVEGNDLVVSAIVFGKDKLESNTAFVVYNESDGELVALMEIHTSCSKPLFVGKTVFDNNYSLEVSEGTKGGTPSIPESEPLTCEDKKAKSTGTITIRKALTNDNGGTAQVEDFTITVTNVETTESFDLDKDQLDASINVKDVPQGTYKISETGPSDYTTVLIAGDTKCPSMLDEEFTIKKGKNISCTIYNDDDFISGGNEGAAPTMTITVQVIGLVGVSPDQFEYSIGAEDLKMNGDTVNIPTNMPVMFNQTNYIDSDPVNPTILPSSIEGDGNCPDVLGAGGSEAGFLTLSPNQNIECIIVYGKIIEPGVIFHVDSVKFNLDDSVGIPQFDLCDSDESKLPCVIRNNLTPIIVPNVAKDQLRVSTLVLLSAVGLDASDNTMHATDSTSGCTFSTLLTTDNGNSAFVIECSGFGGDISQYRVNFALIETLLPGKDL